MIHISKMTRWDGYYECLISLGPSLEPTLMARAVVSDVTRGTYGPVVRTYPGGVMVASGPNEFTEPKKCMKVAIEKARKFMIEQFSGECRAFLLGDHVFFDELQRKETS